MPTEYQILLAFLLDLALGDPRWFPHPVRIIGRLALFLESRARYLPVSKRRAGAFTALTVVGATAMTTYALVMMSETLHPWAGEVVAIFLIYAGIATRDLLAHSASVLRSLESGDLVEARRAAGLMCGRDTENLDEEGVARATVESVAENLVDGVTAPLFFAFLAGPVGIMAYKAVSTLDSTFGYKDERYREFGWVSARLDDVAAFIPSRLTAVLVPVAAALVRLSPLRSLEIFLRDRRKHPSPNAGQTEAAFAGALGVRLGGLNYYQGVASHKPTLGDPVAPLDARRIGEANRLMLTAAVLALILFGAVRVAVVTYG
ncbi:MAG: cobalamin biosynthesis protein CobD [Deltaproteobacteria bacterium]|nr:cobalamin biosynthesis protein CobD [Deltaproteobacteria bacterium]